MEKRVFITGASGLLGQALIRKFLGRGHEVLAHYYSGIPFREVKLTWIKGNFSTSRSTDAFLLENRDELKTCTELVCNYGPITIKPVRALDPKDFQADFQSNCMVSFQFIRFFLAHAPRLESVATIGFHGVENRTVYKEILTYACAKKTLLELTRSLAAAYPKVRFNMVSPCSITGAAYLHPAEPEVSAENVAEAVYAVMHENVSGENRTICSDRKEEN